MSLRGRVVRLGGAEWARLRTKVGEIAAEGCAFRPGNGPFWHGILRPAAANFRPKCAEKLRKILTNGRGKPAPTARKRQSVSCYVLIK